MSDSTNSRDDQASSFLQRWSRRKQEQAQQPEKSIVSTENVAPQPASESASPQAIPDVDSLNENSEVSMFFKEQVSETIKRQALRKLFHMNKFNVCDGLDDYAEDYTLFEPLGEVMTAHQRLRKESESLNQLVSDEAQNSENERATEDVEQLAEYETTPSSFEEAARDHDEPQLEAEKKEG